MSKYPDMRIFCLQNGGAHSSKVIAELDRRLNSESTYSLPFHVNDHQAFVMLSRELHSLISSINEKHTRFLHLCHQVPSPALTDFAISSMLEEIQQSNEFENVHSTRREIWDAIEEMHNEKSRKRFNGMVRKYNMLINKKDIPLRTSTDVRNLYNEFILDEVIREDPTNAPDGIIFRKDLANVVNKHDQIIHRGLSPESKIIEVMDQSLSMLHDSEIDPLIRIAAFHYMFGYIHPFYDGNGRMTRFISSYMLSKHYEVSACLRIAYIIKDRRSTYQQIFKDTNDPRSMGDLSRFVIEFLRFFDTAIDDAYNSLDERSKKHHYYQKLLQQFIDNQKPELNKYSSMLQRVLVIELFGYSSLDIKQIAALAKSSINTARTVMQQCGALVYYTEEGKKHLYHINLQTLDQLATANP